MSEITLLGDKNMDLKLQGKTALISGSTAGIGFAIAKTLAREGATVVINGRTQERVSAAIQQLNAENPAAKLIPCIADLSTEEGSAATMQQITNIDILINNVGIYEVKSFTETSDADWLRIFNINVLSGIRLSRHYLPKMLQQNWGRIIFISSESGINIPKEMIHYGVTKTAQISLARGLAELTAGTGVTVNSVLPGPTHSEGVNQFLHEAAQANKMSKDAIEKEFFVKMRPGSLLQRFIESDEIAALVTFIASPLSAATNGAALRAEGGVVHSI